MKHGHHEWQWGAERGQSRFACVPTATNSIQGMSPPGRPGTERYQGEIGPEMDKSIHKTCGRGEECKLFFGSADTNSGLSNEGRTKPPRIILGPTVLRRWPGTPLRKTWVLKGSTTHSLRQIASNRQYRSTAPRVDEAMGFELVFSIEGLEGHR